jgi:hypothetical protein
MRKVITNAGICASLSLALMFSATLCAAGTVDFTTPPSAVIEVKADVDWRDYAELRLDVQLLTPVPESGASCTFFFQTKQELWFQSAKPLHLDGTRQEIRLSLTDTSPDWECRGAKRPFGRDVLRWISTCGLKVFGSAGFSGRLMIGDLQFSAGTEGPTEGPLEIYDVEYDRTVVADRVQAVSFRVAGFSGNAFDSSEMQVHLMFKGKPGSESVPGFFVQDFISTVYPGTRDAMLCELELPHWQANWKPTAPGEYEISADIQAGYRRISERLGSVTVLPSTGESKPIESAQTVEPARIDRFLDRSKIDRLVEYRNGSWSDAVNESGQTRYWHVPLDWTPRWGRYTGAGEFDQAVADEFERMLASAPATESLPILLFDEDVLDDQGTYNWVDNPMAAANGGYLEKPSDVFSTERSFRTAVSRARYMLSRFGQSPKISGLLILASRKEEDVVKWIDSLAARLSSEFPGLRIWCGNPELLDRWKTVNLALYDSWEKDERLSQNTHLSINRGQRSVTVQANYVNSAGIVSRKIQHWAGAAAFSCDVLAPPELANELAMLAFIRLEPNSIFQSKVAQLRPDEWNRTVFDLTEPGSWTCVDDKARVLQPNDVMNIREVGLRFFYPGCETMSLTVKDCRLLWPYAADAATLPGLTIEQLVQSTNIVARYERFDLEFGLNRVFNNPYDPDEIDVMFEARSEDGSVFRHPGYYHEPWFLGTKAGVETVTLSGPSRWRVRVSPTSTGRYEWTLSARAGEELAEVHGTFTCVPGTSRGFLQRSQADPRCFELSDGTFFFPIGHNLRSPGDLRSEEHLPETRESSRRAEREGTKAYEKWFKQMRENGANFTRIWMCPWWCGLEASSTHTGYHGVEYYNQGNAARLDRLMELAEAHEMYVNLETMNHGMLSTVVDSDWEHSPWNKYTHPNGYLAYATEYITNERAIRWHRNRIRYAVARWGYSTAIAWWGVITETEWTEPYYRSIGGTGQRKPWIPSPYQTREYRNVVVDWLDDMAGQFRQTDAHPHIVSSHFSNPGNGMEAWSKSNLDVVHNNAYTDFTKYWEAQRFLDSNGIADMMFVFSDVYKPYCRDKPLLVGEWGGTPGANRATHLTTEFHVGLWSMLMTRMSGLTGFWWWHVIDTYNLYPTYRGPVAFMQGEDRRGKQYVPGRASVGFPNAQTRDWGSMRRGLVLAGEDEMFAYIYCNSINRSEFSASIKGFDDRSYPKSGEGFLTAPGILADGQYDIEYWNTFDGIVVGTNSVILAAHNRQIPVMSHGPDIALKVKSAK